jgi:hypothetical protein
MEVAACGQVLNAFGGKREEPTIRTTIVTRDFFSPQAF